MNRRTKRRVKVSRKLTLSSISAFRHFQPVPLFSYSILLVGSKIIKLILQEFAAPQSSHIFEAVGSFTVISMHGWRHSAVSFIYLLINKFSVREVALAVYEHLYSLEYIYIYIYIYSNIYFEKYIRGRYSLSSFKQGT